MDVQRLERSLGVAIRPASTVQGAIKVGQRPSGSFLEVPFRVIAGRRDGPVLWLQACIHGDEYDGAVAAARVGQAISPDRLSGTIIVVPVLNISAYENRRRTSPIDD